MEREFGKEKISMLTTDFGHSKGIAVTHRTKKDLRRHGFVICELRCTHDWKNEGETGYGSECEDNPKLHEKFDINDFPNKEAMLDSEIFRTKEALGV